MLLKENEHDEVVVDMLGLEMLVQRHSEIKNHYFDNGARIDVIIFNRLMNALRIIRFCRYF